MTLGEMIASAREEASDKSTSINLWSDDYFTSLANESEMEACRRARLLVDSTTPDVCQVTVSIGDGKVDLDSRVIFVRRAKLASQQLPLRRIHRDDLDGVFPGWETATPGVPLAFCANLDTGSVQLVPPSAIDDTLNLTVVREPLVPMSDLDADSPEIAARYHFALVQGMLARAFSKQDSQTNDPQKAAKSEANFEKEFGPRSSAVEEEWIREQQGYGHDGLR